MAGAANVQEYLQKHKIGGLFEELMGRVISDQPDEPLPFLIRLLERKAGKSAPVRRSMGDLNLSSSMGRFSQTAPVPSTGEMAVAKSRDYEKPWKSNVKRTSGTTKKAATLPDPKGRKATNVDDLWEGQGQRSSKKRSGSPTRPVSAWSTLNDDEDIFVSSGYEGPRRQVNEADVLAGELPVARKKYSNVEQASTSTVGMSIKKKGPQASAVRHKQELEKLVMQKKAAALDSGYEDDKDLEHDDAVVMMEDLNDLRSEGVKKVHNQAGVRMSRTSAASSKPDVKIAICARCAKVMTGEPSERAEGSRYGELPDFDQTSESNAESQPQSAAAASLVASDDEFESVSQVSGPRRPVWQAEDSDSESLVARKGKHMFTSNKAPVKGRPMYSGTMPPQPAKINSLFQSEDLQRSLTPPSRGVLSHTWAPDTTDKSDIKSVTFEPGSARDSETYVKEDESRSEGALGGETMGWDNAASDVDTDATTSVYDKTQGRKYMGAF